MSARGGARATGPGPAHDAGRPAARRTSEAVAERGSWARIYAVVRRIPRGRVATYGQVAMLAGLPRQARLVGYALHAVAESSRLPWHRVINTQGRISLRGDGGGSVVQRLRLEQEGVAFDARGVVDLERFGWRPRER